MLITDGHRSYAVFIYLCGAMNWERGALVGYRSSGRQYDICIHAASFSDAVLQLGCNNLYPWENLLYSLAWPGIHLCMRVMCSFIPGLPPSTGNRFPILLVEGESLETRLNNIYYCAFALTCNHFHFPRMSIPFYIHPLNITRCVL